MADDTTPKERTRTHRESFKSAFSAHIDKTDAQVEQINLLIAL
jgi:ferritin-like metal-binding protein YciE